MSKNSIEVLYEDNHLLIVNKKPGQIVQADKTGDTPLSELVKRYIKAKYQKPGEVFLGVTHRIDRPVSGVCVFARTTKALTRMNEMFQKHEMHKVYYAIVKNMPSKTEDTLEHYLIKNEKLNKSFLTTPEKGKLAKLHYKLIANSQNYHLLQVRLYTGRHHQIRCQLASIGCPIKGDLKYGFPRSNEDQSICLHARSIEFIHPVKGEKILVEAPVPSNNLWRGFDL